MSLHDSCLLYNRLHDSCLLYITLGAILMFPFRDASPATHDKQQKTTQATFIALQTESPLAALNSSKGSGASRGPTKRRFNPFS